MDARSDGFSLVEVLLGLSLISTILLSAVPMFLYASQVNASGGTMGNASALASEVWRAFLFAMAVALLVEAWLCFPERRRTDEPLSVVSNQ